MADLASANASFFFAITSFACMASTFQKIFALQL
jgi:hypothetical protein